MYIKTNKISCGMIRLISRGLFTASALLAVSMPTAYAQDSSIYVQCPTATDDHPEVADSAEVDEYGIHAHNRNADGSAIKCDHLTAGDGMSTMADNNAKRQYIFGFARISLPGEGDAVDVAAEDYPSWTMDQGTLSANTPAPTIVLDEDDEYFLNLSNTGMIMRPDLFDPHTIHWHGFPQAASIFDGVPDSSISVNMGSTLAYYYKAKDAGTYMYHCHVEATEHMQMGMLGNLFVRPRQNRLADGLDLSEAFANNAANVTNGGTVPAPAIDTGATHSAGNMYAYNDGDGTTLYDIEVPIQLGSFDPDFHDASFNTQPLPFASMRDRFFFLNGRGYPDAADPGSTPTVDPLGRAQDSQPISSLIQAAPGQKVLLRISNLNVTDVYTVGVNGLPMEVVALDSRLLRDDDGNNMYYKTNSVTIGGGQSVDAIIDTTGLAVNSKFLFYIKNLDKLANDAENMGGMMTEIQITPAVPAI